MALIRCSSGSGGGTLFDSGTETLSNGSTLTVTCGFKPKYVAIKSVFVSTSTAPACSVWVDDNSGYAAGGNASNALVWKSVNTSDSTGSAGKITNITDTGFTVTRSLSGSIQIQWFAVG